MGNRRGWVVVAISAALVASACGDDPTADAPTADAPTADAPPTTATPNIGAPSDDDSDTLANSAATSDAPTPTTAVPAAVPATASTPTDRTVADDDARSAAMPTCERLTDFADADERWVIVNDGVMGGRSVGAVEIADSLLSFTGELVVAGGGFTSVRLDIAGNELAGTDFVVVQARPDGRTYELALEDESRIGRRSISHGADLVFDGPAGADGWRTATVDYAQLRPTVFGAPVDAPAFEPGETTEFGIFISDGVDGPFAIDIDWIDVCRS